MVPSSIVNLDQSPWGMEIGGYEVVQELAADTALAMAEGNRPVVLKTLDPDCLSIAGSTSKLHPTIRDRLARVRELAHGRVANLHGVERDRGMAYLIWEYIPGQTIEEWGADTTNSPRDLLLAARDLILIVEALHARGIVHGAIHEQNVIVDPHGQLRLTHLSPLLYNDPQHDMASIADLLNTIAARRGEAAWSLASLVIEATKPDATLRRMGAAAASLIDLRRDESIDAAAEQEDIRRRGTSRLGALAAVAAAVALALVIKRYAVQFDSKLPHPPEAPRAMVE